MYFKGLVCTQCGAKDFQEEGEDKLRCNYCKSLFFIENNNRGSGVTIEKGATVIFEPTADVTIFGNLDIEDGAEVVFDGKIQLVERGSDEEIEKSKLRLEEEGSKDGE